MCIYIYMIYAYVYACTGCSSADLIDAANATACRGFCVSMTWHLFGYIPPLPFPVPGISLRGAVLPTTESLPQRPWPRCIRRIRRRSNSSARGKHEESGAAFLGSNLVERNIYSPKDKHIHGQKDSVRLPG